MKNTMGKTRKVDNPYEIYRSDYLPNWEWRVLKKYQNPENEKNNPYARWFCAVKSPMTYGDWEYGDVYVKDILVDVKGYKINMEDKNEKV
jgi:hypothetical protein